MKRLKLGMKVIAETPQAAAELLRGLAIELERNIFPHELTWGTHLGDEFKTSAETEKYGDAEADITFGVTKPRGLLTYEFVNGDPTLPWHCPLVVRLVSISADHSPKDVSPTPGHMPWFLFDWGYVSESHYHEPTSGYFVYATDGDEWIKFCERDAGGSVGIPEVTYDVPMSDYLTDGDQELMKLHIQKHLEKILE